MNISRTYLSHVHGFNLIFHDPYQLQLGQEIGSFYTGVEGGSGRIGDANATFFASDGIAGFGLPGIPIMGALCAAMFWALDSCTRNSPIAFSASALTVCTISLANTSLFSAFLGGGLFVWMLLFVFMPAGLCHNASGVQILVDPSLGQDDSSAGTRIRPIPSS